MPKVAARENMIKSQILTGHVLDERITGGLGAVEREAFVPTALRCVAYVDQEIPLEQGRFLMEPLDFARFLKYAAVGEEETVLDIGCATGYSSAVLARLARRVVALEEVDALAQVAAFLLAGCPNAAFRQGPLVQGASDAAPYDVILIEGAIEYLPQALADQLREGGRLLAGEHEAGEKVGAVGLSKLVEYRKVHGKLFRTLLRDANIALLPAFRKPPVFKL